MEIGCGIGRLSEFIAPHVDRLYGIDISDRDDFSRQETFRYHKNTIFMATDGIHFPLESESVDVIFPLLFFNICQALMLSAGTSRRFHVY